MFSIFPSQQFKNLTDDLCLCFTNMILSNSSHIIVFVLSLSYKRPFLTVISHEALNGSHSIFLSVVLWVFLVI